jgi:Flp pilus assembly protein TadD
MTEIAWDASVVVAAQEARALVEQERWQEALAAYRRAAEQAPDNFELALHLGVLLSKLGQLPEGERSLRRGLVLAPQSAPLLYSLSHNLLAQGQYREGWRLYRAKEGIAELSRDVPRNFPFPRWNGENLTGKRIVLFPEQGLGDQIQLARFIPPLLAQGASVTLLTRPSLARLFRYNFPAVDVVAAQGAVEFADPDYWAMLYDLPICFGIAVDNIPAKPYLTAPAGGPALVSGFNVGLKTKGNPKFGNDKYRSLPDAVAEALREKLPGNAINLEPEQSRAADMADTAAIIQQLDLVVSVDTSVAHLAGALGKPCLLLVPGFSSDWRWIRGRDDSPWYPGHRLFWGGVDGYWGSAIEDLVAETQRRIRMPAAAVVRSGASSRESLRDMLLRGQGLYADGRYSEALDLFRRALRLAPDNPAALSLLGVALMDIGRLKEAEGYQRRALAQKPDHPSFQNSLSLNLLAQGRFREAWPLHEGRSGKEAHAIGFPTDVQYARWRGEPLEGKHIVILPEQGFGDAIQFFRFLPRLAATGARITLFVQPALVDLFAASIARTPALAGITLRSASGEVRLGNPDYWTTLIDMMQPLDVTIDEVGASPYLFTDREWSSIPGGCAIGLVTCGNPGHANDKRRSLGPNMAMRLEKGLPGTIVSLDPTISGARDFADTAALIQKLDLVVSVDTSVAHLAGALGKTCLLLVPGIGTDWRWMRDRDDSSWYAQHRLFRSSADGNWSGAIDATIACAREICSRA